MSGKDKNLLAPGKEIQIIKDIKVKSDKDGALTLLVETNPQLQQVLYDQYFKKYAQDVEIKGFRKGQAPRELVEPQIYNKVVEALVSHLYSLVLATLPLKIKELKGEDIHLIDDPVLEDISFKMIESPVVFKIKVFYVQNVKIPDVHQFKVDQKVFSEEVKVSDKEVDQVLKNIFEEWRAKVDKRTAVKYKEPTDDWVRELKVDGVTDLKQLQERIREGIVAERKAQRIRETIDTILHEIYHAVEVDIPKEYADKLYETQLKGLEEQLKQLGVTLDQYFKANNIDEKKFKEDVLHSALDRVRSRLFWEVYIKQNQLKIEDNELDKRYIQQAVYHLAGHGRTNLSSVELATQALLLKAQDHLFRELGIPDEFLLVGKKELESSGSKAHAQSQAEAGSGSNKEEKEHIQKESKILIPEDAKI